MEKDELSLRQAIIKRCLWMNEQGLNQGTSGNISARYRADMLITPSATPYHSLKPEMIARMSIEGDYGSWSGPLKPSSEWRFHLDIMRARPEAGAVVHTHSHYATALAITQRTIPAVHYMVAAFGGNNVRCAEYATYGTAALSQYVLRALEGRNACLMANHGQIALGANLEQAMWTANELETLSRQYFNALLLGDPVIISDEVLAETLTKFSSYGLNCHDEH